jgi:hypothetical protein
MARKVKKVWTPAARAAFARKMKAARLAKRGRRKNPKESKAKRLARKAGALAWAATKSTARVGGRAAKAGAKAAAAEVKASICRQKNPKRRRRGKVWTSAMRAAFAAKMAKYRKHPKRARRRRANPVKGAVRKIFILAEKGKTRLWFNGAHFSNRVKAVSFSSLEKAKAKAHALLRQFPVLKSYHLSLVTP